MWWVELLNSIVALLESGAGGGGGAYESIATATGTGSSGTITFSSIPSTYKHLQLRFNVLDTASGEDVLYIRLNSDSGSNYANHYLLGQGTTASAGSGTSQTVAYLMARNLGTSSTLPWVGIVDIHDYTSTTKNKTIKTFSGNERNGSGEVDLCSSLWMNTSAVNSITFVCNGNLATTTTVSLYGIKGA